MWLLRSEGLARHRHNVRFAQQTAGKIGSRLHSAAADVCRHIRIGIERALRQGAGDPRNLAQADHDSVAQAHVVLAHFFDAILRAVSAATAAFCTIDVGFEVDWLCSFCIADMIGAGASA